MPLIKTISVDDHTVIGIWNITESVPELIEQLFLNEEEMDVLLSFKSEQRRKQWLSCRTLIRQIVKEKTIYKIYYTTSGKPFLTHPPRVISVSHSDALSAVIISSDTQANFGIDIEKRHARVLRIADKFLSAGEKLSFPPDIALYTSLWTIKEAIYKCYDFRGISLRNDIRIIQQDNSSADTYLCTLTTPDNSKKSYRVHCLWFEDYRIAYTSEQF